MDSGSTGHVAFGNSVISVGKIQVDRNARKDEKDETNPEIEKEIKDSTWVAKKSTDNQVPKAPSFGDLFAEEANKKKSRKNKFATSQPKEPEPAKVEYPRPPEPEEAFEAGEMVYDGLTGQTKFVPYTQEQIEEMDEIEDYHSSQRDNEFNDRPNRFGGRNQSGYGGYDRRERYGSRNYDYDNPRGGYGGRRYDNGSGSKYYDVGNGSEMEHPSRNYDRSRRGGYAYDESRPSRGGWQDRPQRHMTAEEKYGIHSKPRENRDAPRQLSAAEKYGSGGQSRYTGPKFSLGQKAQPTPPPPVQAPAPPEPAVPRFSPQKIEKDEDWTPEQ